MATQRFIVLSDTHFYAPGSTPPDSTWWNRVLHTRSPDIAACLVDTVRGLAPDFVIHCGDLVGHGEPANFDFACQVMGQLGCPWYVVPGNHDTVFPGVRAGLAARAGLAGDRCSFAQDLAGLRFLFLDVAHWFSRQGECSPYLDPNLHKAGEIAGIGPSPVDLAWLEQALSQSRGQPVVLVSHAPLGFRAGYPAATLPHGQPVAAPQTAIESFMGDVVGRAAVREQIARHPNVRLALAGHWHIGDRVQAAGVTFVQTAALREFPFEFRLATLDGRRLRVRTCPLLDPRFAELSYVPEWGNAWVAGQPADREFEVDLWP